MQVKAIAVNRHINLPNGQSLDISVTGNMNEGDVTEDAAKTMLHKVLSTGVVSVLRTLIMSPTKKARQPATVQ